MKIKIEDQRPVINMLSQADRIKGQGVLSAYEEQVKLVKDGLSDEFDVTVNKFCTADITHVHTVNPGYFLSLPFRKGKGTTVGYVHFLPSTVDNSLQMPKLFKEIFYKYLITFYKNFDYLVTVNPYFIQALQEYGISSEKVTYIPNYVSDDKFYKMPDEEKSILRAKYKLDPDKFTVVCAGQLQTRKGVMEFAKIAEDMPDLQFVWAGGFAFKQMTDGYKEIKKLVENHSENLHFVGIVEREKMNEIYNLGDVMFLPSYEELFPMVVLEAMSCGLPILLRDIDIYSKILFDYYLRGSTTTDFEKILLDLKTDPSFYKDAAQKSHQGHEFYSAKHVLSMWDDFYTSILMDK